MTLTSTLDEDIAELRANQEAERLAHEKLMDSLLNSNPEKPKPTVINETFSRLANGQRVKTVTYSDNSQKTEELPILFNIPGEVRRRSQMSDAEKSAYLREFGIETRKNKNVPCLMELPV